MMKRLFQGLCLLLLLISISPMLSLHAQSPASSASFTYDALKEVTLTGTVASLIPKASRGMIIGSHILLTTLSGSVDVSLGILALQGDGALPVAPGQEIEVRGVMKSIPKTQQVFFARTVKVGERTYAIRNQLGMPMPPKARERANQSGAQNGGAQ
jgi:hypothetical protein